MFTNSLPYIRIIAKYEHILQFHLSKKKFYAWSNKSPTVKPYIFLVNKFIWKYMESMHKISIDLKPKVLIWSKMYVGFILLVLLFNWYVIWILSCYLAPNYEISLTYLYYNQLCQTITDETSRRKVFSFHKI